MRAVRMLIAMGAVAMLLATTAQAQDDPGRDRPRRPDPNQGRQRDPNRAGGDARRPTDRGGFRMRGYTLTEALAELEMTEAQKAQVDPIVKAAQGDRGGRDRQQPGEDVRAIYEKMRKAREAGDRDAYEAARKELQALRGGGDRSGMETILRQLAGPLTERQMAKLKDLLGPAGGFLKLVQAVDKLKLTPEQDRKLGEIIRKVEADAKIARTDAEKAKLYNEAGKAVMDLLTDEQKRELARAAMRQRGRDMFASMGVTEEQQETIESIREDARKRAEGASDEDRRTIFREAYRKIFEDVLTDEQKAKFRQMRQRRGGNRGRGRGGDRQRPGGNGGQTGTEGR